MRLALATTFSALLAVTTPVLAQTRPCRTEWPVFAALAGEWRVRLTYRTAPGQYDTSAASAVIEADPERCLLVERLAAPAASRPMNFLFVLAFAHTEGPERLYYDSEHARFLVFAGQWDGEAARFERSQQMNANRIVNRTEVRPISADAFTAETLLSTDGGETWSPVQTMAYSRAPVSE